MKSHSKLLLAATCLLGLAPGASAQRINLHFGASSYTMTSATSPATPSGPSGTWNNITTAAACDTDVAVVYSDGSAGPTLSFDAGRGGSWSAGNTLTDTTINYTTSGGVFDVPGLYENGFNGGNNSQHGLRLRGLAAGAYKIHVVPMYRSGLAAGASNHVSARFYIGTGNDTDNRGSGNFTLVTTEAQPTQHIDTRLTSWTAATDGSSAYNYVTATVTLDGPNRWLTILMDHPAASPDRPGPCVIQIEPAEAPPSAAPPAPVITEALLSAQGMILRGTNGPATNAYQVLASTNLSLPLSNWPSIGTNLFDLAGNFDSTNPLTPGASRQFFRLLVGGTLPPAATGPSITTQPQNQTVLEGENATFSVAATGTAPLFYQWYFNTHTVLAGGTNATLTLANAQTTNAGGYFVIVTNSLGAATSVVATLTVNTNAGGTPDFGMIGYATLNGGTTGGQGGATVTVSNFTDFNTYVGNTTTPYIIQVQGTINLGGSNVRVRNNKTIIGLGANATLVGDLKIDGNNNVIIRNLNFTNPDGAGDNDGLTLQDCRNVWVDHCTFYDGADGNLDISHGADWITVSWCRFFYTNPGASHRFSNLVGHSDNNAGEDAGKLRVTFHHNWWGALVTERMPRVRFGRIHSFNNYFNSPGNNYCIRAAMESEVRLESNYFLDVKNPWEVYVTTGTTGKVHAANNILAGSTFFAVGDDDKTLLVPGTDTVFVPAYSYTLDAAAQVPNTVTNHAGAGKGPYAP